ncbi:MAG: PASTA domain-containing protein [Bacteroidetes bacterium]|jgi:serine/threonine-protein kinase|nr:PASTA domain-containing protein [Bacteroidota bacterium]
MARPKIYQRFTRERLRRLAIVSGLLVAVFFLVDDVIMPLYTAQGRTTMVPSVLGLTVDEAKEAIRKAGLEPREAETRPDKAYKVGTVAFQNPPPQATVKYGRGVYLTISGGEVLVMVPALRGKSLREATFSLERVGLRIGEVRYEPSDEIFMNTIISQTIDAERKVRAGSAIGVLVSQGKVGEQRAVPNLTGRSLNEARKLLLQAGFVVGSISYQASLDLLPNTIIDQYPRPAEMARYGQMIDLFVAQRVEPPLDAEN